VAIDNVKRGIRASCHMCRLIKLARTITANARVLEFN
jgi:hypothetical protein